MSAIVEMLMIDVSSIVVPDVNPRMNFDQEKLQELAESIKEKGVLQPILVRPIPRYVLPRENSRVIDYELVAGERRLRAAKIAGLTEIPAVVREMDDQEMFELMLIENLHREDLHPLEEAEGYEALLKKYNYKTADEIAAKTGKSKGYIYGRLKLCELTPENRGRFYEDKFSASVALLIARIPANLQENAGRIIAGEENDSPMSYRSAVKYIHNEYMLRLNTAPFASSCAGCAKRTGNQPELFAEVSSADVCTDPECFKAKKAQYAHSMLLNAKEEGHKVLSEKESKKLWKDGFASKGLVTLDSVCENDAQHRTYEELIKKAKDASLTYTTDPETNNVVRLISKTECDKVCDKLGLKKEKSEAKSKAATEVADTQRREKNCFNRVIDTVMDAVGQEENKDFLIMWFMGKAIIRLAPERTQLKFIRRRDPSATNKKVDEKIHNIFSNSKPADMQKLCIELLILIESEYEYDSELLTDLCNNYKIKSEAILEEIINAEKKKAKSEQKAVKRETKPAKNEATPVNKEKKDIPPVKSGDVLMSFKGKNGESVTVKSAPGMSKKDKDLAKESMEKVFGTIVPVKKTKANEESIDEIETEENNNEDENFHGR